MKKFLRAAGAAVLAASLVGCSVYAESDSSADNNKDSEKTEEKSSDTTKALSYSSDQTGKEETVYVFTDANGQQNKVIVSDKLHTAGQSGSIKDYSDLKDIINVSGDEEFTQDADGNITWQSDGKDISYQGTSDKEIPVDVKVTYYLNDQEVSADQISGASGHIKIRYDYTNNATEQVAINGQTETVKVPFAMVTGLILNDSFSNVSVTNGKMIQYENNDIVYGIAFPGLKDSLKLDSYDDIDLDNYDIPEYVEIEGDTTNFGIDMSMTYASSNLLNDLAGSEDIDLSDLTNSVNDLDNAATQLVDGTKTLKDGTSKLKDGANQLNSGADSLVNGASQLASGAAKLSTGAATLSSGANTLASSVDTVGKSLGKISSNSAAIDAATDQVAAGILKTANTELDSNENTKDHKQLTLDNYSTAINELENKINGIDAGSLRGTVLQTIMNATGEDKETTRGLIYLAIADTNGAGIQSQDDLTKWLSTAGAEAKSAQSTGDKVTRATDDANHKYVQKLNDNVNPAVYDYALKTVENAGIDEDTAKIVIAYTVQNYDSLTGNTFQQKAGAAADELASVSKLLAAQQSAGNTYKDEAVKNVLDSQIAARSGTDYLSNLTDAQRLQVEANVYSSLIAGIVTQLTASGMDAATAKSTAAVLLAYTANNSAALKGNDFNSKMASAQSELTTALSLSTKAKNAQALAAKGFDDDTVKTAMQNLLLSTVKSMSTGISDDQAEMFEYYLAENWSNLSGDDILAKAQSAQKEISDAERVQSVVNTEKTDDKAKEAVNATLDKLATASLTSEQKSGIVKLETLRDTIKSLSDFVAGVKKYTAGIDELYTKAFTGDETLTSGANQLASGAKDLASGAKSLSDGANTLLSGTKTLKSGTESLSNGIVQLDDGADTLMNGMQQFYDEGIKKISDVFGDELTSVVDRVKSVLDSGTNYTTYGGALDDKNNTVRFIFKTDTINADDSDK